jgi:hypothetical protein
LSSSVFFDVAYRSCVDQDYVDALAVSVALISSSDRLVRWWKIIAEQSASAAAQ